jgi:hypothetical protein
MSPIAHRAGGKVTWLKSQWKLSAYPAHFCVEIYKLGPITLWQPELATIEWLALALFLLCAFLAFRLHWGIIRILLVAAGLGAVARMIL